jgi:zinc transporter ZupT
MIMQELLTAVTYPIGWLVCSYVLKIESGLAKLLISLTAAILVYVLIGIKLSQKENKKDNED